MPSRDPIPVYVFTGLFGERKTQFIKEIIADPGFTENERTALLLCEEGIEEYDEREMPALRHGDRADRVGRPPDAQYPQAGGAEVRSGPHHCRIQRHVEADDLLAAFPARWELYQIVTTVDASTFELYSNNMGPMMFEHITTADLECSTAARTRSRRCCIRRTSAR